MTDFQVVILSGVKGREESLYCAQGMAQNDTKRRNLYDSMIHGVRIKPLKVIVDERGFLMEILRCDDEIFERFGQVYLTACYPGVIKGWHLHKRQTDYFCVVKGMAKVVLADLREDSPTKGEIQEFFIGERNPIVLVIPPNVWHGFKAVGGETAYVINCPNLPYDPNNPDEYRLPYNTEQIPYDWGVKHG